MNNNIVDKCYLALELTKLYVSTYNTVALESIMSAYNYFFKELTGIDSINQVDALNKQLQDITYKYQDLKENMELIIEDKIAYKKDVLNHLLENSKGDMEPYVYKSLQNLIKSE